LTIKCLDLMRSAVESNTTDSTCISFYNPYSIVKELRSRRPTLSSNPFSGSRSPQVSRLRSSRSLRELSQPKGGRAYFGSAIPAHPRSFTSTHPGHWWS